MESKLSPLIHEVERLVTAPYVPSLQDLYGLVQNAPFPVLCSWVSCKPCQVAPLVDVLVDALSYSRIALDLICIFAPVVSFRNALLERYPAFLDQMLQKAVEDEPKYLVVCTALLSPPLPLDFTAPACLAGIIIKLVHQMAGRPSAETIHPIYRLMNGLQTSPRILCDIPSETMSSLQGELLKTLRNMDDHMGNLLCLATFARIASSQGLSYDYENGPQTPTWLQNVRHFFGPKRGLKTLDLVVLRVILVCSASCNNLTVTEAAESVRLAIDICDTVEPEQKQVWISGNTPKVAKLCEKVTREGIPYEVQMMGVVFLISLLPVTALSSKIAWLGLQGVLSKDSRQVLGTIPPEFLPRLVRVNAVSSGRPAIHECLSYTFSALNSRFMAKSSSMATLQVASLILFGLQNLEPRHKASIKEVSLGLESDSVRQLMESFPRKPLQSECNQSSACYAALSTAENELLVDLCVLYSRAFILRKLDDMDAYQEHASVTSKFADHVKEGMCKSECALAVAKSGANRDLFSYPNTRKVSSNPRRDWRVGISETLMSSARASYDGLMEKVGDACRDLEHRCYNTETPIRATEEERDKATLEARQLRQHNSELEVQLQQALNTITDLQQNVSHLEGHAESTSARAEDLCASLNVARKELEDERHAFDKSSYNERESARTRELEFRTILTEKDDYLEELQRENSNQRARNEKLRETLDSVSREHSNSLEFLSSREASVSHLADLLKGSEELAKEQQHEIESLRGDIELIGLEKEDIQKRLDNEVFESGRLRTALPDVEQQFRSETDVLKKEYEMQLSHANAENVKQREENKALQESMHAAASDATSELQTKEKRIHHLERKIQSLRDERAAKACEFSVAQEHIGRLMNVMGFKPDSTYVTTPSSKHPRSRSALGRSPIAGAMPAETNSRTDSLLDKSFDLTAPNPSNGRSPKRARGDSLSLDMITVPRDRHYDPLSKALPSRNRTSSRRERRPLEDADQNSQAGTSVASQNQGDSPERQIVDEPNRNKLQDIDLDMDVEFTKDFLFTSTSLSDQGSP